MFLDNPGEKEAFPFRYRPSFPILPGTPARRVAMSSATGHSCAHLPLFTVFF